tara:strand:- start:465 stop:1250 length:786 start_codon:yes stop_codon:yes gene_type:complete
MNKVIIGGTTAGFFSIFRGTVGTLALAEQHGVEPVVIWRDTLYNDKPQENAWDYYFDAIGSLNQGDQAQEIHHFIMPREYQTRVAMNQMINKYVKVKPHILEQVDKITEQLGKNPLGVHIRMTDKYNCVRNGEPESHYPLTVDHYKKHIDLYLEENDSKIFLATDDIYVLEEIERTYGDRVVRADCTRSTDKISIHHHMGGDKRKQGEEVLIDCLALSRCKHILKGVSNVALCAMFWNLDLTCENLNSIYIGDTTEDFVSE